MRPVTGWSVLIPLKPLDEAKTRLRGLPVRLRRALVVAMARDVRDAVLASHGVAETIIVTRDPTWRRLLGGERLGYVADSPRDSLNDALRRGAAACRSARPGCGIAALTADLPALRPTELELALEHAEEAPTLFVPDARGVGTTLFAARSHSPFCPQYGIDSRARHITAHTLEFLRPELTGIRQDVDTLEDLERAQALGAGEHTNALMSAIRSARLPAIRLDSAVRS